MAGRKQTPPRSGPDLFGSAASSASERPESRKVAREIARQGKEDEGLLWLKDKNLICCGIDEVGRGCLAGPVVAAAVILPPDAVIPGLADSKVIPATRRAGIAAHIGTVATAWGIGVVWPRVIDEINILEATFKAMSRAVRVLKTTPHRLLVDGDKTIPAFWLTREAGRNGGREWQQRAIVKGDARVPAISAASVLAKVFRDNLMEKLDHRYPGYGFAHHMGYGTKEHLEALHRLGPSPMHRLSFRKVRPESDGHEQGSLL